MSVSVLEFIISGWIEKNEPAAPVLGICFHLSLKLVSLFAPVFSLDHTHTHTLTSMPLLITESPYSVGECCLNVRILHRGLINRDSHTNPVISLSLCVFVAGSKCSVAGRRESVGCVCASPYWARPEEGLPTGQKLHPTAPATRGRERETGQTHTTRALANTQTNSCMFWMKWSAVSFSPTS